ncbi:hypothetical protein JG688_00004348 [Phytophthora aleatoria]|uniref:Uncharacterized protein n=1 Tax=Phytophthora aleatoria TaxID=2496075 RepID=A0A8J5MBF3_9STRA|nr:hypothetical protein JG688_00004348 [Phytophthora aleatoria]
MKYRTPTPLRISFYIQLKPKAERMKTAAEGEALQSELRLEQHEVKRLIREALSKRSFPPAVQYLEAVRGDVLLLSLFLWSVVCGL